MAHGFLGIYTRWLFLGVSVLVVVVGRYIWLVEKTVSNSWIPDQTIKENKTEEEGNRKENCVFPKLWIYFTYSYITLKCINQLVEGSHLEGTTVLIVRTLRLIVI